MLCQETVLGRGILYIMSGKGILTSGEPNQEKEFIKAVGGCADLCNKKGDFKNQGSSL